MTVPAPTSNRGRAIAVLAVVGVVALALIVGLVYLFATAVGGRKPAASGSAGPSATADPTSQAPAGSRREQEDALADAPMLRLPASAAQPQPLVQDVAGPPIVIPEPTAKVVPGGPPVATGFPHTPEGALAQLAAIDEGALSTTDLARVHEVYAWAAQPGAVSEAEWSPTVGVTSLRHALGDTPGTATYQAVEGQIKGTVGSDFVVACVLGELDVTASTVARGGVGDCQRMVWSHGRWWIGPGSQPYYPPSAWPGSADSVRGGWRELRHAS